MKDFPVFTTDGGVSSLTLRQIPYRKEAYIRLQDVQEGGLEEHLQECASFCRIAGAERVFASGHEGLERYPLHMRLIEMRGVPSLDEDLLENIWPVTAETAGRWRSLYNERMRPVDNAALLEQRDEAGLAESGGAYFIHRDGQLLGIGWIQGDTLKAIASLVPGMGRRVAHTLLSVIPGHSIRLEVASTNERAIRLYESLGLLQVRELERWYKIF